MRRARALLAAASGVLVLSCQLVLELGDKVYVTDPDAAFSPTADGGGDVLAEAGVPPSGAGDSGPDQAGAVTCPAGTKGGPMVLVGGAVCVGATEVTRAQYAAFLAATSGGLDVAGQPAQCSWNTSYQPGPGCGTDAGAYYACTGADCDGFPQACVDWCDAFAYCKWAGTRLCGSPGGGAASLASLSDPATSQWTAACTSSGKHRFPYGDAYVALACADEGNAAARRRPKKVATFPDCQSKEPGFEGVFDLSANVGEWEDACVSSAGSNDRCRVRGGTFFGTEDRVRCDHALTITRNTTDPEYGFRCCAP